jgi:hypothetical protein
MIHKIFGKLLRQIGDTGGWEFAEFWAINQEYRVLQFCPVWMRLAAHWRMDGRIRLSSRGLGLVGSIGCPVKQYEWSNRALRSAICAVGRK